MVKILVDNMAALINAERKARGLRELYAVPYLNECSEIRAEEASVSYSHYRPNGEYCSDVIDYNKFRYGYFAENLACGSSDVKTTLNQWRNSSQHWTAIINANTTHMGIFSTVLTANTNGTGVRFSQMTSTAKSNMRGSIFLKKSLWITEIR